MTSIAKRQYVLSSRPLVLEDMQEHRLAGKYLYTHRELNMGLWQTADGMNVIFLGNAFCTDARDKQPEDDIRSFCKDDLLAATKYWTGRWSVITEKELFTDASGLMSAFYASVDGHWVVTSSPALLAQVTGKKSRGVVKQQGLSWQILPGCIVEDGNTLLCTQRLVFTKDGIAVKSKLWMEDRRELTSKEKCHAVADILTNGMYNIHRFSGRELMLALTGGKDSRMSFAALLKARVPFSCYTAHHSNIVNSDVKVPKKLTKAFGIPYRYIKSAPVDKGKENDYKTFTAGNSNGADLTFYARGQFEKLPKNAIVIRSGLYEAGQTYGRTVAVPETFDMDMRRYYSDLTADSFQSAAFDTWLNTVKENPVDHVDIRDRFYVEQRVGGWAAAIEHSLDMNDFVSIQIANCAELLSLLLSCNEQERKELTLSYGTMEALEPKVLAFAVNKITVVDVLRRVLSIACNPMGKLRNYLNRR